MLEDSYHRSINYIRVSITDRCNLRCIYCAPSKGFRPLKHEDILQYEEILRILRIASDMGLRKVRITGGEPLIRRNITYLIKEIKQIENIKDLSITTNGIFLEEYAEQLKASGLDRINISLDSLNQERYKEITRGGDINSVLRGISAAEKAGLTPIKLNVVVMRGINDDELTNFAKITLNHPYQVRFIEFMPFGIENTWSIERFIPSEEIKSIIEKIDRLIPISMKKSGPARYYKFEDAPGVIGFISPLSNHFCNECNRLRLTPDGKLRPCLFSETEIDLKYALRNDALDEEIKRLIKLSVEIKPKGHNINFDNLPLSIRKIQNNCKRIMSQIGG
jgi:cyclic pyranopterin phosphate synthase